MTTELSPAPLLIKAPALGALLAGLPAPAYLRTVRGRLEDPRVRGYRLSGRYVPASGDAQVGWSARLPAVGKKDSRIELHEWGFVLVYSGNKGAGFRWPEGISTADLDTLIQEAECRKLINRYAPRTPEPRKPSYGRSVSAAIHERKLEEFGDRHAWVLSDPLYAPLAERYGAAALLAQLAINAVDKLKWSEKYQRAHARETSREADAIALAHPPRGFAMTVGKGWRWNHHACSKDPLKHRVRAAKEINKLGLTAATILPSEGA